MKKRVRFVRGREGDPVSLSFGKGKIGLVEKNSRLRPEIGEEWEVEVIRELARVIILRPIERIVRTDVSQRGFELISGKKVLKEIPFSKMEPKEVKWNFVGYFPSQRILLELLYSLGGVEKKVEEVYDLEETPFIPKKEKEKLRKKIREFESKQAEEKKQRTEEKKIYEREVKKRLESFDFSNPEAFCKRAIEQGFRLEKVLETDSVFRPRLIIVGEEAVFPFPESLHSDSIDIDRVLSPRGKVDEFPGTLAAAFLDRDYLEILAFSGFLSSARDWLDFERKLTGLPQEFKEEIIYGEWNEDPRRRKSSKPWDFVPNPSAEEEAKERLREKLGKSIKEFTFSPSLCTVSVTPEVKIETDCDREVIGGWHPESDDGHFPEGSSPILIRDKAIARAKITWKTEITWKTKIAAEFKERLEERIKV